MDAEPSSPWLALCRYTIIAGFVMSGIPQGGFQGGGDRGFQPPSFAPSFPLRVSSISASPDPRLGQVVTVSIEITSSTDEADVTLTVQVPEAIDVVNGQLTWRGSLRADEPFVHQVAVVVLEEGDWTIHVTASSRLADGDQYGDYQTVHLVSDLDSGIAVPGLEYQITQEDPALWAASQFSKIPATLGFQVAAAAGGNLTIQGRISYEASENDGGNDLTPVGNSLHRARVELWDFDLGGGAATKLASTNTRAGGFYTFTVANTDPDGTGLDPYLLVFADDLGAPGGQRARVIDQARNPYYFADLVGVDLGEGTYDVSPTIERSATESQAFYIFDKIANLANGFLLRETDWPAPGPVTINWPRDCEPGSGSCFVGGIFLTEPDGRVPDVVIHEYGHYVMAQYYDLPYLATACFLWIPPYYHEMWQKRGAHCAWTEGWPDFFEMAVQNDPDYRGSSLEDVDVGYKLGVVADDAEDYEGVVAASLWDLFDDQGEDFDELSDGFNGPSGNGIWHVATTDGPPHDNQPHTILEFWTHWLSDRPSNACFGSVILQHHKLDVAPAVFTLTTSVDPAGGGLVSANPAPNCPADTYEDGTPVTLTAAASPGYLFTHWSGDASGTDNPLQVGMVADKAIQANFAPPTPTPTPTVTPSTGYFLTGPYNLTLTTTAGTQYAHGVNAVQQPDGSSFAGVVVRTDYGKTGFKDAQDLGYTPRLHGNSSPWDFGPNWYCRTRFSGPTHPACVFAAGQLGVTFATPRPTSYWNDAGAPGSTIYSAFTIESVPCCSWPSVTGHLEVYYIWSGTFVPTPTPDGTPAPTPTVTVTPPPPPTPAPCSCFILCLIDRLFGLSSSAPSGGSPGLLAMIQRYLSILTEPADVVPLLQDVRDDVMAQTPEGQRLIALYDALSPELAETILPNDDLSHEAWALVELFVPNLQALSEGRGDEVMITQEQVDAVETFLDHISAANPELQRVITDERNRRPLQPMVGLTMDRAWERVNGYTLEWLPPLDQAEALHVEQGDVVPVAFALRDYTGDPTADPTVALYLIDLVGTPTIGPIGPSTDPGEGLVYEGSGRYRYNLPTEDLLIAPYRIVIAFNSPSGVWESAAIWVDEPQNAPPTADAGGPYQSEEGEALALDASGSTDPDDDIDLYEWDLDADGEFDDAVGITAEVTFGDNGTFSVGVRVMDAFGASSLDTAEVTVENVAPEAEFDLSGSIGFAGGEAFLGRAGTGQEHEASATDPGSDDLTFTWTFGASTTYFNNGVDVDPFPSPGGTFPFSVTDIGQATFASPGMYSLELSVTDDDGGASVVTAAKLVTGTQACTQGQGFWKHQFSGQGRHQVDDDTLEAYLALVNHASSLFSERTPVNNLVEAGAVMDAKGPGMRPNAEAQLLAAWLNFAQGSVGWDELVDTDRDGVGDMAFHDVVAEAEALLLQPDPSQQELVRAKDLAEAVNLADDGTGGCG